MRALVTADAREFWRAAGAWLEREPVRHSVPLTVLVRARAGEVDGSFAVALDDAGEVTGAAMRTPPHPVHVAGSAAAATVLAEALVEHCPDNDGAGGEAVAAAAFARAWSARTGAVAEATMRQRLYELSAVVPPAPVPGRARLATGDERELLVAWVEAFLADTGAGGTTAGAGPAVDLLLAGRRAHLWDDAGPACLVGVSPTVAGVARVAPVYTPPARRRRGYASALVGAVSQAVLDAGADRCALYTDLANPTSNHVYAALGYRPVADATMYAFRTPARGYGLG